MIKTSKILFLIVGCIFPIFIGALHTFAHFMNLLTPEIQGYLQKEITILGEQQIMWNTWGLVSFMMGASFIVIGLLNTYVLRNVPANNTVPTLPVIAMILYQLCVVYVGYEYNQNFQFYGGLFGLVLTIVCLGIALKFKE